MTRALRSVSEVWATLGFGCLLAAAMGGGLLAWQLAALDGQPIERSSGFVAVMQPENKGYVLQTAGRSRISCTRDFCGYPSSALDLGITRTYYMVGGRLIGVERDGELIDLRDELRAKWRASLWIPGVAAALAIPCFWAAIRSRKAKPPESSRTPA
ncbi:hypothetical protein [Pelomonas sp. Root1217]|uniref:hypothetical protein n=1 Tax=Pelomonas sp. Root1217 TaxID=1736430 RepID=UPI0012F76580|nr:hypothetical protein [Pelomonas sp. Root1217]